MHNQQVPVTQVMMLSRDKLSQHVLCFQPVSALCIAT